MAANPPSPGMTSGAFTATVTAITSAFGDPTRRAVYLFVREQGADHDRGVTATQVADHFGLHPNVARHHLDKLAIGGYLDVAVERPEGAGAGRPSKHYRPGTERAPFDVPVRSDDLVLTLLGRALAELPGPVAQQVAEEVGEEYGRVMAAGLNSTDLAAGQQSLQAALAAVADALTAHGFAAHTDQRHNRLRIINNHCPFGDVAIEHPVICAVDRGMVKGMLTALYGDATGPIDVSTEASRPQGDTFCATAV